MDIDTVQLVGGLVFIGLVAWLLLGKKKTTVTVVEAPATVVETAPEPTPVVEAPVAETKPAKAKKAPAAKKPAAAKKAPAKKPAAKKPVKKTTK